MTFFFFFLLTERNHKKKKNGYTILQDKCDPSIGAKTLSFKKNQERYTNNSIPAVIEIQGLSFIQTTAPLAKWLKAKAVSSHILTWTVWVQFPPSPTHNMCLLCSAMRGLMKLACLASFKQLH
jgi:hypothetical protein